MEFGFNMHRVGLTRELVYHQQDNNNTLMANLHVDFIGCVVSYYVNSVEVFSADRPTTGRSNQRHNVGLHQMVGSLHAVTREQERNENVTDTECRRYRMSTR